MKYIFVILIVVFVLFSGCSIIPSLPPVQARSPPPPTPVPVTPTPNVTPSPEPTLPPIPTPTPVPILTANLVKPLHRSATPSPISSSSPSDTLTPSSTPNSTVFTPIRHAVSFDYIVGTWGLVNHTFRCNAIFATNGKGSVTCPVGDIPFIGMGQTLKWYNSQALDNATAGDTGYIVVIGNYSVTATINSNGDLLVDQMPDGSYFIKTG